MKGPQPLIKIPETKAERLASIFQKGIRVPISTGFSIKHLLCEQWGIDENYEMNRISTIFLDFQPVDDMDTAIVWDGAVLSLSSAMPGLMGATMRRGGYYAAFRSGITHDAENETDTHNDGVITLKLFNLLIKELGPRFIKHGFWADREAVVDRLPGLVSEKEDEIRTESPPLIWVASA